MLNITMSNFDKTYSVQTENEGMKIFKHTFSTHFMVWWACYGRNFVLIAIFAEESVCSLALGVERVGRVYYLLFDTVYNFHLL